METRECLMTRRSIRKYKPDPISDELLMELLEPALAAPSAVNQQHWYFVVVRSPEAMEDLRAIMRRVVVSFDPILRKRFERHPEVVDQTTGFMATLGNAPVCVLAFFLKNDFPDRDGAVQSVSAAIENQLLSAWDKGIGSCWISAPQRMGFGRELGERFAPGKGEFMAAITLGWPDQVAKRPPAREGRVTFV